MKTPTIDVCVLSVNFHFTGNKVAGVICSNHMLSMKIHIFKTSYSKLHEKSLGDALTLKTFHSLDIVTFIKIQFICISGLYLLCALLKVFASYEIIFPTLAWHSNL